MQKLLIANKTNKAAFFKHFAEHYIKWPKQPLYFLSYSFRVYFVGPACRQSSVAFFRRIVFVYF